MNYLCYKDNKSLFINLIEYRGLYFINAITTLLPTPTAYTISTRFFTMSVYNKVQHKCLLHYNIKLVEYLLTVVDKVKVVKTDRGRTLYSVPLCKLYILGKITQQTSYRISIKGTYPFKYIYFDIIIEENGFNRDTCVAHFQYNYIKYYCTFPIKNHK